MLTEKVLLFILNKICMKYRSCPIPYVVSYLYNLSEDAIYYTEGKFK